MLRHRRTVAAMLSALLLATLGLAAPAAVAAYPTCGAGWVYTDVTRYPKKMRVLMGPFAYENDSPNPQTFSLTKYVSGTVSFSASAEGSVSAGVIIAKVEAKFGVNVSLSKTVAATLSASMKVDPHRTGHLAFGVWRFVSTGHYYYLRENCTIGTDRGYIRTYSPWYVGFRAWQTRY
jgi:hypothetical protein